MTTLLAAQRLRQANNGVSITGKVSVITGQERGLLLKALQFMHDARFERGDVYDVDPQLGYVYVSFGGRAQAFRFNISAGYVLYAGARLNLATFAAKGGVA